VLGDQEEKDKINPSNKIWEDNSSMADEHLNKMDNLVKKTKNLETHRPKICSKRAFGFAKIDLIAINVDT
jgi:hypothetical protein